MESYTDYDTILNLLIMGDISSINGGVNSYQGWRNDVCPARFITPKSKGGHWVSYKEPKLVTNKFGEQVKEYGHWVKRAMMKKGALDSKNALLEEYAYLFDGEKWWVSYYKWNEKTQKSRCTGWLDLAKEVEKRREK